MTPEEERRLIALEAEVKRMAEQLKALERIEVAPESGGGHGIYSRDNLVLFIGVRPT